MKYFLDLCFPVSFNGVGKYTATSKARVDIINLMQHFSFKYIPLKRNFQGKFLGSLELLIKCRLLQFRIKKSDVTFVQYPMMNIKVFFHCYKALGKGRTIALVHDLQSYRVYRQYKERNKEIKILNAFSCLIVHTNSMREQLINDGVKTPMIVLEVFDYLLPLDMNCFHSGQEIVFAGALAKSVYLKEMDNMILKSVYNLYSAFKPETKNPSLIYKGKFSPDDISTIQGGWGLIWDGDSIETCTGQFGEYLRLISPHKCSLYIAAKLKVIVWEESAMAPFVIKYNIGITIKSVSEIDEKLSKLSIDEISIMDKNVSELSEKLRKGTFFCDAFSKASA